MWEKIFTCAWVQSNASIGVEMKSLSSPCSGDDAELRTSQAAAVPHGELRYSGSVKLDVVPPGKNMALGRRLDSSCPWRRPSRHCR
jgi:hypothetical protein